MTGTPSATSFIASGMFMNVASSLRPISASFIDGKSVYFCDWKTEPVSLCSVIQLVTGQVRWQVTGRKPTVKCWRSFTASGCSDFAPGTAAAGTFGMYSFFLSRYDFRKYKPTMTTTAAISSLSFMCVSLLGGCADLVGTPRLKGMPPTGRGGRTSSHS